MTKLDQPRKPVKPRHGTERRYRDGCRCDPCKAAHAQVRRLERSRARAGFSAYPRRPVPTDHNTPTPEGAPGPIEAAARAALEEAGGDSPVAATRREVAYRAAAVMDDPKLAPYFKSAADVLRATVEDLQASKPATDAEAEQLGSLLSLFGSRGRRPAPCQHPG